jgi:hypothetical protein
MAYSDLDLAPLRADQAFQEWIAERIDVRSTAS